MTAALELSFDPFVSVGGALIRWDALALVAVLAIAIGVWIIRLRRSLGSALRFEDVAFVLLGAIPGAVVVGRLVHVVDFADSYQLHPVAVLDLAHGSASLVGAVVGGALSAAYICRLLGGRVGVWADAAAVPLLLAIGLGKVALMLGGGGQGQVSDGPLALAFTGAGPWRALDPAMGAWPSQLLEGSWAILGIPVILGTERLLVRCGRAGRGIALLGAVAWWLAGRGIVALTWRDMPVLGPLGREGTAAWLALVVALLGIGVAWRRQGADARLLASPGPTTTGTGGP